MALILLPVLLIVTIIVRIAHIRARRVTVLFLFRFSATGFFTALLLPTTPLFAMVFVGIGSLVTSVSEICFITVVYGEYIVLFFTKLFSPVRAVLFMPVG